jgi:SAM-dependent methyltransferase
VDSCIGWVQAKLARGAKFADVGCGHGASTILLAKAFPKSEFIGYDYHRPSIEIAAQRAKEAGVTNPAGAAQYARAALRSDGTCMVVEPFAGDEVTDNLTPLGRNPDIVPKLSDVSVAGAILGDDREPRVWGFVRYRGDL